MNRSLHGKTRWAKLEKITLLLAAAAVILLHPGTARTLPSREISEEKSTKAKNREAGEENKPVTKAGTGLASITVQTISGSTTRQLEKDILKYSPGENAAGVLVVGPDNYKTEDILFLKFEPPAGSTKTRKRQGNSELVLNNGDHFWGTPIGMEPVQDEEVLTVANDYIVQSLRQKEGQIRLNLSALRLLLFRHAFSDETQWARFRGNLLKQRPKNDVAHLSAGTRLTGFLDDLKPGLITFSAEGVGQVKLPTEKIRALDLAELEEEKEKQDQNIPSAQQVDVFLKDGGNLRGALVDLGQAGLALRHELLGGLSISLEELSHVSFLGGRCQYLSDMDPVKTTEHLGNLFLAKLPFKRDRNVLGKRLRMKGKTYPKGLGVHAYSKLDYDLAGGFRKFQATIGLDDSARPPHLRETGANTGSVVFRVLLDGKTIAEKPMNFGDPPHELDLPVNNGRTLSLEVDFGGKNLSVALDRANWCGARVIK